MLSDPEMYRETLGVMLQDFTRYPLSARENVALGCMGQPCEEEKSVTTQVRRTLWN